MRKRMFVILTVVLVLAMTVGAFAACGGQTEPNASYTVTFNANGGTLSGSASLTVTDGRIADAPTASRDGYAFAGWFPTGAGGTAVAIDTYEVAANVSFYAQWTADPAVYTVNFDANGGTLNGKAQTSVTEGGKIADAPTASRTGGYTFLGWYLAKNGGTAVDLNTYAVGGNVTLYARWQRPTTEYTVTFDANGGTLTGNASVTVALGGKLTGVPTAGREGYEFLGWFNAAESGEQVDVSKYKVRGEVTLYAQWKEEAPAETGMPVTAITGGYRIEAEDADIQGTPSYGNSFIENDLAAASGSAAASNLSTAGNTVTFVFNAQPGGSAELIFRMASTSADWMAGGVVGDQVVSNDMLTVKLNNANVPFTSQTVHGSGQAMIFNAYFDPVTMGDVTLASGTNTVTVEVLGAACPNIDCLDIMTDVTLTGGTGGGDTPGGGDEDTPYDAAVTFDFVIGGYAGGPAIEKTVVDLGANVDASSLADDTFTVSYETSWFGQTIKTAVGNGASVYPSDADGNAVTAASRYVTIEYDVAYNGATSSFAGNLSPFTYDFMTTQKNVWNDLSTYSLDIADGKSIVIGGDEYTTLANASFGKKIIPCLTDWSTDGTFTYNGDTATDVTLTYGAYEPAALGEDGGKNALIIWLHGMGEGGTDPTIAILGNQVTGLSSDTVQKYFKNDASAGAYVLAPQSPTMWMDGYSGTEGGQSKYTDALWALIKEYVRENGDVDEDRIYIGGCSNGGYMTMNMLFTDTEDYFAAAFPICEAYAAATVTDAMVNAIKDKPIWITHAKNDTTVPIYDDGTAADDYSNNIYARLLAAGADNAHYSLFKDVTLDGVSYNGHWSWIYALTDNCVNVQAKTGTGADGAFTVADLDPAGTETVTVGGEAVSLWGWIAAQTNAQA